MNNNRRHWVLLKYSTKAFDNGVIRIFAHFSRYVIVHKDDVYIYIYKYR